MYRFSQKIETVKKTTKGPILCYIETMLNLRLEKYGRHTLIIAKTWS